MPKSTLPKAWTSFDWSPDLVPLPLGPKLQPLDQTLLDAAGANAGKLYVVAPADAVLAPNLLHFVRVAAAERPDVGIFYGDEAETDARGQVTTVRCKPSFNPALLQADDYVGFPLVIRASVLAQVRPVFGWRHRSAAWYRLCLEALTRGIGIDRIPETLIAVPEGRPRAEAGARRAALRTWFAEHDLPLETGPGRVGDTLEIRRLLKDPPPVTLVVPTRQSRPAPGTLPDGSTDPHIVRLLDSLKRSSYPQDRIRVLIGDDEPDDAIYRGRSDAFSLERVVTTRAAGEPFNYAAKMNQLWRRVETDAMVLMNDDVVVRSAGWLEALMTFALDRNVGGVGARLIFPNSTIQHAGMFGGIFGACAHPWYGQDEAAPTYSGWALTQRDCSVVTGAVFATRRGAMEAVNGFDETFSLDFNDVDLCLKMRMLGLRIVYTPFAELWHNERSSRQNNLAPGDQMVHFVRRWADVLANDPAYSPQLRADTDRIQPRYTATQWVEARRA